MVRSFCSINEVALIQALPIDLALKCAALLEDPRDRAALCLALPPLGLMAIREELSGYRDISFAVAMWLENAPAPTRLRRSRAGRARLRLSRTRGAALDETVLRRYASDSRATVTSWLRRAQRMERWLD